jgi:WD40 repeat protein
MRIPLATVALCLMALLGGCAGQRPPAAPVPGNGRVESPRADEPACEAARALRRQAAQLYADGRLERTVGALREADGLCRQEASSSTELLHKALAELGLLEQATSPRVLAEADEILRQGFSKKAQGDTVGAQKLFDRARVALERLASSKVVLEVETGIWNVAAMAWSDDGSKLAIAAGQDVHVLRAPDGVKSLRLHADSGRVTALAISPDSRVLASSTSGREVTLWSLGPADAGARIGALQHEQGELETLAFSPDGKTLAGRTWGDPAPILWDVEARRHLRTLDLSYRGKVALGSRGGDHGGVWSEMLAWSPDGGYLLGAHDGTLAVWDLHADRSGISRILQATGPKLANEQLVSVAFHPNGRQLAAGTDSGKLLFWSLDGGPPRAIQAHRARPQMVFSRDGERLLTVAIDGSIRAFAAKTREPLGSAQVALGTIDAVAPHPAAHRAALAGKGGLLIEDVSSGEHLEVIRPLLSLSAIAVNASGTEMALGTPSGSIVVVSLRDGSFLVMHGHTADVESIAFSPDGRSLVSVSLDKTARIWDLESRRCRRVLDHPGRLHSVAFRPDGRAFATAGDNGMVRVWDAASGGLVASPSGTSCAVVSLVYSPEGSLLIANASDHSVLRWDTTHHTALPHVKPNNECVGEIQASVSTLGLLGDGTLIPSAPSGNEIELWSAQTGHLQGILPAGGLVRALAVRPGDSVVVAAVGGAVRRWQLPGGMELPPLTTADPSGPVDSLAFSADGRLLLGASLRGTVSAWSMSSGALLATLVWTDESSALAMTPSGPADWFGSRKPAVSCRLGARVYPGELCEDRYFTAGLLPKVFSGQ